MGLRCKADGCRRVLKDCRCRPDLARHWQADVWVKIPARKGLKRRWVKSPQAFTKRQALLWYGGLRSETTLAPNERRVIPNPVGTPPTKRTFAEAATALLKELENESAAGILRATTYANHVGHLKWHLNPRFGASLLDEIDVATVRAFSLELAQKAKLRQAGKLKSRTVRAIINTMGMVYGAAMDREWTERNPVARLREAGRRRGGARLKKKDARPPMPLTETELLLLEEATRAEVARIRLPILLMAFCGLRRGEAFGLQRRDFDAAEDWLRVERIVTHGDVTVPKANSGRVQPVPDWLAEELRAYIRTKRVATIDGSDWLFATHKGEPLHWNAERTWARVRTAFAAKLQDPARRSLLAGLHMHDLRHTYQTVQAEKGVAAFTCQALMGHATVQMTGHYTHVSAAAKRAAAALLPVPRPISHPSEPLPAGACELNR